jgi:hypothetical protein
VQVGSIAGARQILNSRPKQPLAGTGESLVERPDRALPCRGKLTARITERIQVPAGAPAITLVLFQHPTDDRFSPPSKPTSAPIKSLDEIRQTIS